MKKNIKNILFIGDISIHIINDFLTENKSKYFKNVYIFNDFRETYQNYTNTINSNLTLYKKKCNKEWTIWDFKYQIENIFFLVDIHIDAIYYKINSNNSNLFNVFVSLLKKKNSDLYVVDHKKNFHYDGINNFKLINKQKNVYTYKKKKDYNKYFLSNNQNNLLLMFNDLDTYTSLKVSLKLSNIKPLKYTRHNYETLKTKFTNLLQNNYFINEKHPFLFIKFIDKFSSHYIFNRNRNKAQFIYKVIEYFSHLELNNIVYKKNMIILKNSLVDRFQYNVIKDSKLIRFITNPKYKNNLEENDFTFNHNNMMKIFSKEYINEELINTMKNHIPKLDIIDLLKNFEDSNSKSYIKQFILNVIFCITLQKHDGTAILYGKSNLDKPLIDLLIICKQFYKNVHVIYNIYNSLNNLFIFNNFDETKRSDVHILWKLYHNIPDDKYVIQLLDFEYSKTFINEIITYDSKKYNYAIKFYKHLQNIFKNESYIHIQLYNFLQFYKSIVQKDLIDLHNIENKEMFF